VREESGQLDALLAWFGGFDSALVAFSGGVDSAVVIAAAHRALGPRALACIGVSPSYPLREQRDAVALAERCGFAYRTVDTQEHLDAEYAANPSNRCYFCKRELYGRLATLARVEGWAVVCDGTNASDAPPGDGRPGRLAGQEHGVRSPLAEVGVTKPGVRGIARALGLAVWDKPAMACLSSRVPTGTPITPALLRQIETAEDALVALGFRQFRVRHHGDLARIELPSDALARAIEKREAVIEGVRAAGYRHVTLDLAGFRGGAADGDAATGPTALTVSVGGVGG
jgi:uncharacterized protein